MSQIVKDIGATVYMILDNCSEQELDYPVFLEQYSSVLQMMNYEKVFGNLQNRLYKQEVTFTDTTGIVTNTLPEYGKIEYLEFNGVAIEECPVNMLDLYYDAGLQRVAFWTDASGSQSNTESTETKYIQLSIAETGTLKIWYEPFESVVNDPTKLVPYEDSLRYCIAARVAKECLPYVKFNSPVKEANKPVLFQQLMNQAESWKKIYLEKVNRLGTNRPFSRLPFMAQ